MTETEGGARQRHGLPLAILLFLGTNWGLAFSLARFGALGGVPPLGYALWQTAGAGAILLAVAAIRGMSLPLSPAHLRYYTISALVGVAVPSVNTVVVAG
ncbi:MAG: hypothetical protein HY246_07800, partial [Proteobacteria bacterium]|nr:hypothetical protein [Pseudomonadota bacterium]